jgi:hypothetical protein
MRRLRALPVVLVLLLTACGSGHHAAPDAVQSALARVDRALASHQYGTARAALEDLVRRTAAARDAGALGRDQAERITAAAAELSAELPAPVVPVVRPTPTPAPAPVHAPAHHRRKHHHDGEEHD